MTKKVQFDIISALEGADIVTRDGRKVVFGGYNALAQPSERICGWINNRLMAWCEDGNVHPDYSEDDYDLFMLEKYGYVNVHVDELGGWVDEGIYGTYEEAEAVGKLSKTYESTKEIKL